MFKTNQEPLIYHFLFYDCKLVDIQQDMLVLNVNKNSIIDYTKQVEQLLSKWTKTDWRVSKSNDKAAPSLKEMEIQDEKLKESAILENNLVKAVLDNFPGSSILK